MTYKPPNKDYYANAMKALDEIMKKDEKTKPKDEKGED